MTSEGEEGSHTGYSSRAEKHVVLRHLHSSLIHYYLEHLPRTLLAQGQQTCQGCCFALAQNLAVQNGCQRPCPYLCNQTIVTVCSLLGKAAHFTEGQQVTFSSIPRTIITLSIRLQLKACQYLTASISCKRAVLAMTFKDVHLQLNGDENEEPEEEAGAWQPAAPFRLL